MESSLVTHLSQLASVTSQTPNCLNSVIATCIWTGLHRQSLDSCSIVPVILSVLAKSIAFTASAQIPRLAASHKLNDGSLDQSDGYHFTHGNSGTSTPQKIAPLL
jgi:hypothetical protein